VAVSFYSQLNMYLIAFLFLADESWYSFLQPADWEILILDSILDIHTEDGKHRTMRSRQHTCSATSRLHRLQVPCSSTTTSTSCGEVNPLRDVFPFEALFGCMCIHFNPHVLEWNEIEFSLIPHQSTAHTCKLR